MIVAKFGGSSVANAIQFKKVKEIIESDDNRRIVVSSAMGRRFPEDNKITDLLYLIHAHLKYSVSGENVFKIIKNRFVEIKEELNLTVDIEGELDKLYSELDKSINVGYLVSRGEYLTSLLLADYLGYEFVDSKDIIKFNYNGSINFEKTEELIKTYISKYQRIVVPGFYGSMEDGTIKVMSRGGSDITGSILAKCIDAEKYENWTDVSGILMADPRIIDNPKQIEVITYDELRELSYMGANVLHEDAIYPVKELKIPIYIRNTNDKDNPGTKIVEVVEEDNNPNIVTGIAGKKDFTAITVCKHNASNNVGYMKKALDIFYKYNISIEHVPSSIDKFSIIVETQKIEKVMYELVAEIKKSINTDTIKIENDLALVAIVGRNLANHIGSSGALFKTLGDNNINIKMITQGADEINIIVGVNNKDFKAAISCIYETFA